MTREKFICSNALHYINGFFLGALGDGDHWSWNNLDYLSEDESVKDIIVSCL